MWGRKRRPVNDEFPEGFRVQRVGVAATRAVADLPPTRVASYFREHPEAARDLLNESYDKRFTPSSFIEETSKGGFSVGWFSLPRGRECVRHFTDLADAATDYLLFSLGKGRWTPLQSADPTGVCRERAGLR